jgi:hypothetical protein|tara:strand:- start:497 stop:658 length:162 start_codon:yes stop_codon:yes gene_type:complete
MFNIIFDGNRIVCENLEVARDVASNLLENYNEVNIYPSEDVDLDDLIEIDVEV